MARVPDWFERLDSITEVVRQAGDLEWLGRNEMKAIFGCSERDSIRLLHKFGAESRNNSLTLSRSALLVQLVAIREGSTYAAFLRHRHDIAKHLSAARAEAAARQFRVRPTVPDEERIRLQDLPVTVVCRCPSLEQPGVFEIRFQDGADLMRQLAQFLAAAGANREEFLASTERDESR